MDDIFDILEQRAERNAKNAVENYVSELREYRRAKSDPRLYGEIMEFALFIRHRSVDLARDGEPLAAADLSFITSIGRERGLKGFSEVSQNNVLTLHTGLMLREIGEAPTTRDMDGLLRMVTWFSAQAVEARSAYVLGFAEGRSRVLSLVARVGSGTRMLLADDPAGPDAVRRLALPVAGRYAVVVVRFPGADALPGTEQRAALVESLLARHRVPMVWGRPEEFVALVPADDGDAGDPATEPAGRVLALARDVLAGVGRPGRTGTVTGRVLELAKAAETARLVGRIAPLVATPDHVPTTADVFVELGLAQLPRLDGWLRDLTRRLADGPDLVATLAAYYRSDMNRLRAAALLHVHPRTLDYRLRRVRTLTGVDPGTTRGVRLLSSAVNRMLAGAWD